MPRARGGSRQGTPGRAYSNRTDLNTNKLPVSAVSNQQYGQRAAQEAAQKVIPMARPGEPSPMGPQVQQAPRPPMAPPPRLAAPTARPNEPFTAGAPFGAGPGQEALGLVPPPAPTANQDDIDMAAYLPTLELMADQPNATEAFRNWVRRLRGGLPRTGM